MSVALCSPPAFGVPPVHVGVPSVLALAEPLSVAGGRAAIIVPYGSWAVLRDHAACGGAGLIDAAVLPAEGRVSGPALPVRDPSLWAWSGRAPVRVGVPVAHPSSDAALRHLLGPAVRIVPLPSGMLWSNLRAGLLDAAVICDEDPEATSGTSLRRLPVPPAHAATLLPRLAIVFVGSVA